jgi:hypothetical protein
MIQTVSFVNLSLSSLSLTGTRVFPSSAPDIVCDHAWSSKIEMYTSYKQLATEMLTPAE